MLRPGEGRKTLYFLLLNILLGCGMAIGRASSEALFFSRVGVDKLPMFYILLSLTLFLASLIYAVFVDRWSAERLMRGFVIVLLVLLFGNGLLIQLSEGAASYYGYFLLYELVSEILLIHMAHYLGQNLDLGQGKRLMPTILAGTQIGIVVGGVVVAMLSGLLPTVGFVYLWAGTLLLALLLMRSWHRRMGRSPYFYPQPQHQATMRRTAQEIGQGARAIWTVPLARVSAVSMFLLVITFYLLNFAVNKVYVSRFPEEQQLVAFFGWLNAGLSLLAIGTQILLSNRVINWLGIRQVSLLYPAANALSFFSLVMSFSLLPALLGSLTRGVFMPAFQAPTNNLIHSIMSLRTQGRVRAAMVGLVMPVALILCGLLLDQLVRHYSFEVILWLGAAVSLLYVGSTIWRSRCYHRELVGSLKDKIFLRKLQADGGSRDPDMLAVMTDAIDPNDEDGMVLLVKLIANYEPTLAAEKISEILPRVGDKLRDQMLNIAIEHQLKLDSDLLAGIFERGDEHLQASILRLLSVSGDVLATRLAREHLYHQNPRVRAEALRHHLHMDEIAAEVVPLWQEMFSSSGRDYHFAMCSMANELARVPQPQQLVAAYQDLFVKLLHSGDSRTQDVALGALQHWNYPVPEPVQQALLRLLHDEWSSLRQAAYRCLGLLPRQMAEQVAWHGLEAISSPIREASLVYLQTYCQLDPKAAARRLHEGRLGHPRQIQTLLDYIENKGLTRDVLERIADGLLASAQRFAAATAWLAGQQHTGDARGDILRHSLKERFQQFLDAALAALQGCANREEIRIVRAVLASGDCGSRAKASEVLHHLDNRELARKLMEAIDDMDQYELCMERHRQLFDSTEQARIWCRQREDRWLLALTEG